MKPLEPEAQPQGVEQNTMTILFDFENVLCGECSYPLDNGGLCVIDVDHRGILPSGDEARDLEASREQQRLTESQGVELLPCPFCGSGQQPTVFGLRDDQWWVECSGYEGLCCKLFLSTTKEEAIRRWNTRADLPRATANDGYQWGPLLEQAERIVKTWRATDQHDKLLVHYIAQAIRDNATPRATGEIEAALAELREIYPKRWINVICATHSAQQVATKTTWTVSIDQLVDDFEGPSLADCMAQVRAASRTEGEGEGEK